MALGPLLSLPLAALPESGAVAGLPFNHVTAVGWVMAACWAAFFLATALCFPEPPKRLPIGLARDSMLLPAGEHAAADDSKQRLLSADEEAAAAAGQLAPAGSSLLPHAERAASAAWRATLLATAACTAALLVQKMVRGLGAAGQRFVRGPACLPVR